MTFGEAANIVAKKNELGTTLVTGHKASYFQEAAELYCLEEKKRIAKQVIECRDALALGDANEAYHQLYLIASPNLDKQADEVWKELEQLTEFKP